MAAIVGNLILNLVNYAECQANCGTLARSTCSDDVSTKWNKNSVGETLAKWIANIKRISTMPEKEKEHYFLRKTILNFKTKNTRGKVLGNGVQFIANRDCSRKRHIGPTWRKTSTFSGTQFNDGFLYGVEDDNGDLTGGYVIDYYNAYK